MDNQHRKISGYRELSQEEIDLMNAIKAKGVEMQELIDKVCAFNSVAGSTDQDNALSDQVTIAEAFRWAAIARSHWQEGCMALTRAVAKPGFF